MGVHPAAPLSPQRRGAGTSSFFISPQEVSRNLLLFLFPSLIARSAFSGWKILLIAPKRLGDSSQMAVAYLPLPILLCFSTYFFYFLESGVFCGFFKKKLRHIHRLRERTFFFLRFKCYLVAGRGQHQGPRRGFYYLPLPRAWKSGLSSKNSFLA